MSSLKIRLLEDKDIPLMRIWLNKKHIIKWYEKPDEWLAELYGRFDVFGFIKHYIVDYNCKPIGFCQYYSCSDAHEDWYGDITLLGTYGIDYLIGEEEYLQRGFGKSTVNLLVKTVFSINEARRIVALPNQENIASCKSLLANGFVFDEKNKLYCLTK